MSIILMNRIHQMLSMDPKIRRCIKLKGYLINGRVTGGSLGTLRTFSTKPVFFVRNRPRSHSSSRSG